MTSDRSSPRVSTAGKVVAIVLAALCAAFYVLGLLLFKRDFAADEVTLSKGTVPKDHFVIHVTATLIDPIKQVATLTISPEPVGGITDDGGYSATVPITYYIETDLATKRVRIRAGDPMVSQQITIPLTGEIAAYPNDDYAGDVEIDSDAPMEIDALTHAQAYAGDMYLDPHSKPGELWVSFDFVRSHSTIIFAWLLYGLIGVLALSALFVSLAVWLKGYA